MDEKTFNRIMFWYAAFVPFLSLFVVSKLYGAWSFAIGLGIYVFVYRPIIHIIRLLKLGVIERKDAWKQFLPWYQSQFFRELWLG